VFNNNQVTLLKAQIKQLKAQLAQLKKENATLRAGLREIIETAHQAINQEEPRE
jgi:hypothetical protein